MDKNKKAMLGTDSKESDTDKIKLSAPPTTPILPVTPQPTNTIPSILNAPKLLNTKNPSILSVVVMLLTLLGCLVVGQQVFKREQR